ncbi:hypothetical protein D8674_013305 [Pyrus ussuriensis x Pyrus communis]|uniref:Uncharacterized protein n=1 Tax=Pyrus ussuriensis x Pyrus communis TaxID=2448454 RepID=A0A5N5GPB5_9ROSA|nr:hypothetical protein D8674_013305 [Pyrus ussuriensis x Pyrus communis]
MPTAHHILAALLHRRPPHSRCTTDVTARTVRWSPDQNLLRTRPACRLHPLPHTTVAARPEKTKLGSSSSSPCTLPQTFESELVCQPESTYQQESVCQSSQVQFASQVKFANQVCMIVCPHYGACLSVRVAEPACLSVCVAKSACLSD